MKKIVTILGARPQFIKASVVSHMIGLHPCVEEVIVHTGQHFDANMSDVFFAELGMANPSYCLGVHGGTHGSMTGQMLSEIEKVLLVEEPSIVLVYGDTNSTLAGALAAAKLQVPIAHVEAGLRSFNMAMPEEINRILTDRISQWLFTPTEMAKVHLEREGFDPQKIISVGDVMYDVALHYASRTYNKGSQIENLNLKPKGYVLATVHRAENTNDPVRLEAIVDALISVSNSIAVVWPLHPRTRDILNKLGKLEMLSQQIRLIDPVGYLDMVRLEKDAALIATDSGGVQKEAFFHRIPCVTIREETEWTELVDAGWNRLAPPIDSRSVEVAILNSIGTVGESIPTYGLGNAAEKIVNKLVE